MKSITIKAGRTHKWTVDVSGEPPPTLTWIFKDSEVTNSDRVKIENIDYQTNITIINAVRKDTGKYTLIAKNASGKDEAALEFTVLGNYNSFYLVWSFNWTVGKAKQNYVERVTLSSGTI